MPNLIKKLIEMGNESRISISEEEAEMLITYMMSILEKNEYINLTRIIDPHDFITLHILDSLTLLPFILGLTPKILDVGTGAGFPGIPLAIMMPSAEITLLDSTKKKLKVIESIASALKIENITLIHARAEDLGRDEDYHERFDFVTSRAVANLSRLSEYCLPLTAPGGHFLAMKGKDYLNELEEAKGTIHQLNGKLIKIEKPLFVQSEVVHVIIDIEKMKSMPIRMTKKKGN